MTKNSDSDLEDESGSSKKDPDEQGSTRTEHLSATHKRSAFTEQKRARGSHRVKKTTRLWSRPFMAISTALFCCLAFALFCMALVFLLKERPQFVGPPLRAPQLGLTQQSPRIVLRGVKDDVSVYEHIQAESSDVTFNMTPHSDYRGLRTVNKMIGEFDATYTVHNYAEEPAFVLFRCTHPTSSGSNGGPISASALKLQADIPGILENADHAWLWSGRIEAGESTKIRISYNTPFLTSLRYEVASSGDLPIKELRLAIKVNGDGDTPMAFASDSEGVTKGQNSKRWHRENFSPPDTFSARIVETRSIFTALSQLLEMAPIVGAMFLLAVMAVIMSRQSMSVLQVLTISATYSLYYPLILYLSAKFEFYIALSMALAITGVILLNFGRMLLGFRLGFVGGLCFLIVYQLLPTMAAFSGWNRGMVLLVVGVVTLFVLVDLQNRMLTGCRAAASVILFTLFLPSGTTAQGVQVIVPGTLVEKHDPVLDPPKPSRISFGVVDYSMKVHKNFIEVQASLPVDVIRSGEDAHRIFSVPVYLHSHEIPECLRLHNSGKSLQVEALSTGKGQMSFHYRAPLTISGARISADIPLLRLPAGRVVLHAPRTDLEFDGGVVWTMDPSDANNVRYDIGVVDAETLKLKGVGKASKPESAVAVSSENDRIYGIRITRARQLTLINSDGSCIHFAKFELPAFHPPVLEFVLPIDAKVISASVNGVEVARPKTRGRRCQIPLATDPPSAIPRRVSIRLELPRIELGFMGFLELEHVQSQLTIGDLSWVVALPPNFTSQIVSSGLDVSDERPDLSVFGDYGAVLGKQRRIHLARTLAPPRPVKLNIKYRQQIPGMFLGSRARRARRRE